MYRGQFDFTTFSTQIHDFEPGINPYPSGLFWTVPIAREAVDVQMGAGRARMRVTDLAVLDYFDTVNALFQFRNPVSVKAKCSFDVKWDGPVTSRGKVETPHTNGQLVESSATMTWSASNAQGFSFTSDPEPTTSVFAQLGRVRNGVFANQ